MSIELRNINGNMADIYEIENNVCIFEQWCFFSQPSNKKYASEFPLKKVLKLKESGFDCEEIVKLIKELNEQ